MIFPPEILLTIASNLDAVDLRNFRLAHPYFSSLATSLIARNGISVMDTAECLQDLRMLLKITEIAHQIRKLTVYFGEWPVCVQPSEWRSHHLLYGHGISNKKLLCTRGRYQADQAFSNYSLFVAEEQSREIGDDADAILKALISLKSLNCIVISDMEKWAWSPPKLQKYENLRDRIWMAPCTVTMVAAGVQAFLSAFMRLPGQHGIKELSIEGAFDPTHISLGPKSPRCSGIQLLRVNSFEVNNNQRAIQHFLQIFPDLIQLSMSFKGQCFLTEWRLQGSELLNGLSCAKVESLCISGLRASEDILFGIVESCCNSLRSFTIGSSAVTFGSWRSFFTRIRRCYPHLHVKVEGGLSGQVMFRDLLNFTKKASTDMLEGFLKDQDAEWPFM